MDKRVNQRAVARELAIRLKLKNPRSTAVFLNQIFHDKRPMPPEWEPQLLKILNCGSRNELEKLFPAVRFSDGQLFAVEFIVSQPKAVIGSKKLDMILDALTILEQVGIKIEARITKP